MTLVPEPTPTATPEPVSPRPNTQGEEAHHPHHRFSADPSDYSPSSLAAFASTGARLEADWEDDVPEAESDDDVAAAESETPTAAKSGDEEEWEDDVPEAESEDDAATADSEDEAEWKEAAAAAAAELEEEAQWEDEVPAAESDDDAGGEADTGERDSPQAWWPNNWACGDPRKAELFPRPDAVCEARRLQEARLLKRPPPPAGAGDPDEPIWPPKSSHWKRFRELRATESSPANPVLNPDENSLSHPPSYKSKGILSDKVADQKDDTESASSQIVLHENGHGENLLPVLPKKIKYTIDTYAVQCGECRKWRLIPTKQKYDEIREKSRHDPFLCQHAHGWKPGVSCDDPADISQDDGFWVIDRECISQTPPGWERTITIRSEGCAQFADVYYFSPTGKRFRSKKQVENYLQDNPDQAAGIQSSQFSFKIPESLQNYVKKRHRQSKPKRCRQSKPLEPNEVLPLSCTPPIHEDALHDEG